ncbi:hypothetical protein ACTQ56_09340 [[Clostridium] aminophilum]|uniref:hypothetical protein n=1 Tax=[Clostridium] aminophilum TaxID=1526 RepID=UPI003F9E9DAD
MEGPHIALIGELDGLSCPSHPHATEKGFAHACGHYAQIISILGEALALTDPEVKETLNGSVTFFTVPAEEFLDASVRAEVLETEGIKCSGGQLWTDGKEGLQTADNGDDFRLVNSTKYGG